MAFSDADARPGVVVGAAHLFQIQIGDGLRQRENGMLRVVARAEQSEFFAEQRDEHDAPLRPRRKRRQRARDLDHRCRAGCVVIGAVIDVVARPCPAHAEMIVMRGDQHVRVLQRRIGPAQHADDVAQRDRIRFRSGDVRRDGRLDRSRFGVRQRVPDGLVPDQQRGHVRAIGGSKLRHRAGARSARPERRPAPR